MEAPNVSTPPGRCIVDTTLAIGVFSLILLMLATWIPHYLTWPWWPDLDAYSAIAQGWDEGILPYRDVTIFNFPGQIYLFWLLGKAFGWGRTAPVYVFDVGLLLGLGGAMAVWSRRRFVAYLPGLIGFVAILDYYLGQNYSNVAQRDWHGTLFTVLAILSLQTIKGHAAIVISALPFAVGLTIRPHEVLFLPAVALAINGAVRSSARVGKRPFRAWIVWGLLLGLFLALAFLPLIEAGLIPDLIRGVRIARYGGNYGQKGLRQIVAVLIREIQNQKYVLVALANFALAYRIGPEARRLVHPWIVALGIAILYRAIHPIDHGYLEQPLFLMFFLNLALLAWLASETFRDVHVARALGLLAILSIALGHWPSYCSPSCSLNALRYLGRRELPEEVPLGADQYLHPSSPGDVARTSGYSWPDYRAAVTYLRENTGKQTRVVNALKRLPFPPLNGPAGRITPWPCEAGMPYLWLLRGDTELRYAKALERLTDSVVVWVPGEVMYDPKSHEKVETPLLDHIILEHYAAEAKFGLIEIWRRRPQGSIPPSMSRLD